MFKSIIAGLSLMFSLSAFAVGDYTHTPDFCSVKNPQVCAHLGLHKVLKSTEAGQFLVDIMTPNAELYTNLKVDLWMPDMGHGSSPVTLKQLRHNYYLVTDAWFMMPGNWVVRLNFDFKGENLDIEIPMEIKE